MEKCVKRRATIRYGGRVRREACVPEVETAHEMLLLRGWVQGVFATTAASARWVRFNKINDGNLLKDINTPIPVCVCVCARSA